MARRLPALLTGLVVLAGACSRSGRDPAPQAGGTDPGPTVVVSTAVAPSAAAGAAPALVTATAILRAAFAVEPAARLPLTPGAEVVVHPEATFEVELSARVADARLALV